MTTAPARSRGTASSDAVVRVKRLTAALLVENVIAVAGRSPSNGGRPSVLLRYSGEVRLLAAIQVQAPRWSMRWCDGHRARGAGSRVPEGFVAPMPHMGWSSMRLGQHCPRAPSVAAGRGLASEWTDVCPRPRDCSDEAASAGLVRR
jgi:hypothetical protein